MSLLAQVRKSFVIWTFLKLSNLEGPDKYFVSEFSCCASSLRFYFLFCGRCHSEIIIIKFRIVTRLLTIVKRSLQINVAA